MKSGRTFYLDKSNGKLMGVCAGIADYTGWDVTLIRIGLVLVTLLGCFPWTLLAYGVVAWMAKPRPTGFGGLDDFAPRRTTAREARDSMRDLDRRMAEIETYVTHSNTSLAREIESLR